MGAEDYGRFTRELSPDELAGCFFFTDDDRSRIASRRRRRQSPRVRGAARHGPLPRPLPGESRRRSRAACWPGRAARSASRAGTTLEGYGEGDARWEHQAEIRRAYGYRPFGDHGVEDELSLWLRARAWMSAESHRVLFARAAEHLIARRDLAARIQHAVAAGRQRPRARRRARLRDARRHAHAASSANVSRRCCAPRRAVGCPCSSGCGAPRSSRRSAV